MKLIRLLTLIALQIALLGLALHGLLGAWGPYQTHVAAHVPQVLRPTTPLLTRAYWLAAALLPVLYWVATVAIWRRAPRAMRVRTAGGDTLLLHPGTLIKFIRRRLEDHPAVTRQRVKISQSSSKGMSIHARVDVRPIANLVQLRDELSEDIRHSLSSVVGIEKIDNITLILALDERGQDVRPGEPASEPAPSQPPLKASLAPVPPAGQIDPPEDPDGEERP